LIQILCINALRRVSAAFAGAKSRRVNLPRRAPDSEKAASGNADTALSHQKRGNRKVPGFTAR